MGVLLQGDFNNSAISTGFDSVLRNNLLLILPSVVHQVRYLTSFLLQGSSGRIPLGRSTSRHYLLFTPRTLSFISPIVLCKYSWGYISDNHVINPASFNGECTIANSFNVGNHIYTQINMRICSDICQAPVVSEQHEVYPSRERVIRGSSVFSPY